MYINAYQLEMDVNRNEGEVKEGKKSKRKCGRSFLANHGKIS